MRVRSRDMAEYIDQAPSDSRFQRVNLAGSRFRLAQLAAVPVGTPTVVRAQ
jgi:hypothetical protein